MKEDRSTTEIINKRNAKRIRDMAKGVNLVWLKE